ncbi:MBL fold metallo-hydrolase [Pontibacter sp. G13]|uniref:MBL fold metallo-hydrolase n=1 Tax=Pontibacter sp. G13 TaxID=3074898 RepID=UPI002889372B|nr:MBL fold metallo-hydrolase [Pontibacter sp. G13]WNJ20028.1 MBL fold metallo-hydrolase [Pontibacter sp. G13]
MRIHHARNATLFIETADQVVLVDPMLGPKGTMPPFSFFRAKPRKNPLVDYPESSRAILERVTHCLITHKHPDHIDDAAVAFLKERQIPVTCSAKDRAFYEKKGIKVVQGLAYWAKQEFLGGSIVGIPARHGYGFIAGPMGHVMGFHIELPNEPSVYLSADTIYTDDVKRALTELKPDISVVAAGSAQFDIGQPLLMRVDDVIRFMQDAPGKVIANHLEAINHCPTTRAELRERVSNERLTDRVLIPEDGEVMPF